jgi:hypothetical protein
MHVLESYALQDNLKIDKPYIYEKFFPMATTGKKYITIDTSSEEESCKYDYWSLVVDFLAPYLKKMDIQVVQLGDKDDKQVPGCYIAVGQTDSNQKAYVIKNSALHICSNNLSLQIASSYDKRIVALFSNSYYEQFKPYWSSADKVSVLKGASKKPSFNPNENPKTINLIGPEKVAESILRNLGAIHSFEFSSLKVGTLYESRRVESSLSHPISDIKSLGVETLIVRLDYNYNLENLVAQLEICPCSIVANKTIPEDILKKYKDKILELVYFLDDDYDPSFIKASIALGINVGLISREDKEKVDTYKINLLDIDKPVAIIPKIKIEDIEELKNVNMKKIFYKSNKFLIHNGQAFPSKLAVAVKQPVSSMDHPFLQAIDHTEFWEEKDHFYFVKRK